MAVFRFRGPEDAGDVRILHLGINTLWDADFEIVTKDLFEKVEVKIMLGSQITQLHEDSGEGGDSMR